ncbi:MAG: OmpA family protein [Leptospiraceae bacterium]|nr:OmpA family protein [Leptospiraceae bacterium]MCP5498312.1 OmpA family protein [Leptospiraceae bacterium]
MKKFFLVLFLILQIHVYSEEVIDYDADFQKKSDNAKSEIDSLVKLRKLEVDKLRNKIKELELKNQGNLNQSEKEKLDLQKKLNECKQAKNELEKSLANLKERLQISEDQNSQIKKDYNLLKEKNNTLESELEDLKTEQKKLKDFSQGLSSYIKEIKTKEDKINKQYEDLRKAITSTIKPEEGEVNITKNGDLTRLVINLSEAASFNSGSVIIKKQGKPLLDSIFKIITKYPGYHIYIEGHTDNVPIHTEQIKDNWELSTKRALSVLGYVLKKNPGLEPKRFSASGYGEFHPLDTNTTDAGRKRNRRVDIIVTYW